MLGHSVALQLKAQRVPEVRPSGETVFERRHDVEPGKGVTSTARREVEAARRRTLSGPPDSLDGVSESSSQKLVAVRNRRLTSGIVTSVVSRGISALVPFVMIPLTLDYLGTEMYGLWMAVTALTGMAAFADLGLGNGLMTKLAPCYASNDHRSARTHVSNAYGIVGLVAGALLILLVATAGVVPWQTLLNAQTTNKGEAAATQAVVICLAAFIVNIPLSLVLRVQYAYQRVGSANIWQATGSLWSIPLVVVATHWDLGPGLVILAAVTGPLLSNLANSVWLYRRKLPELAPTVSAFRPREARELLALGVQFLVLTVVMSVSTNSDQLVAAHVLGLDAVTTYSIPARLFAQLGLLVSLVNLPLWPANGEALARGDVQWVQRVTRRMTVYSVLAVGVPGLCLVLAGDTLLSAWLGSDLDVSSMLMAGLALWWLMLASISPRFMVQNSVGVVAPQLVGWTVYLVVSVPLKVVAAQAIGLEGIVFAGVVPYALLVVPAAVWGYRRALTGAGVKGSLVESSTFSGATESQ